MEGIPVLSVEAIVEDEVRSLLFPANEPEESRNPLLLGLASLKGRRGKTPSDRVVLMEKVEEPTVRVRVPPPPLLVPWFVHEVGGSPGFDSLPVDGKRGRNMGGAATVVCSSTSSSRDSMRTPELYDLDSGCRWWLNELVVLTDEVGID